MYENVYDEQIKKDCLATVAMHKMKEQADVVIEEQIDRTCKITKPAEGYDGLVEVTNAHQFSVDHPEASVLFIEYAGSFTRYNFKDEVE